MADAILDYLDRENIQIHTEVLNLKSSQAACLNFLFPLYLDRDLATVVMRPLLPGLSAVTRIEFEYTAQDESECEFGCTDWLGEPPGGKRGQHRTSIDAAVFCDGSEGRRCATLIEWKYTERSFGVCSAYDKAMGEQKQDCLGRAFPQDCLLTTGGPHRSRKYWEHLADAGIDLAKAGATAGCPFRGPFYQLMRQFLVARYMVEKEIVDSADVVAVHFRRNRALRAVPVHLRPLGGETVLDAWNAVLRGVQPIWGIEAEQIVAAYEAADGVDQGWRAFILERYRI